jgi:hypothetical protein
MLIRGAVSLTALGPVTSVVLYSKCCRICLPLLYTRRTGYECRIHNIYKYSIHLEAKHFIAITSSIDIAFLAPSVGACCYI